jgi:hypothetical protein
MGYLYLFVFVSARHTPKGSCRCCDGCTATPAWRATFFYGLCHLENSIIFLLHLCPWYRKLDWNRNSRFSSCTPYMSCPLYSSGNRIWKLFASYTSPDVEGMIRIWLEISFYSLAGIALVFLMLFACCSCGESKLWIPQWMDNGKRKERLKALRVLGGRLTCSCQEV